MTPPTQSQDPNSAQTKILFVRSRQRQGNVPLRIKLLQGFGTIPGQHKDWAFSTLLLLYYSQILGLTATVAAFALFLSLVIDAVSDPLVGGLSDNFRSRLGRRHPFMLASIVPTGLSVFALFQPPEGLGQPLLAAWMITFTVLTRLSFTLFSVPYAALAAELSEHYEERTTIMTYRIALGWLVGVIFIFCMYSLMFTNSPEHTNGLLDPRHYAGFGLLLSLLMMCWMTVSTVGTLNQIPYLPQPTESLPAARLASILQQTLSALHNRNFRLLFLATLLSAAINGTGQVFDIYMNLYFWQFGPDDIRWFSFALLGAALAFVSVGPLQQRYEKHQIMIYAMSVLMVMAMLKVGLRFLQVWPENGAPSLLPMLIVHASIMAYGGSLVLIMFASMIADIVDEQEHLTSMRQEGTFSAGVSLAGKSTTGLGLIIGGLLLDWVIALPAGATPESMPEDVVTRLGAVDGLLVPAFYLIPILLMRNYRLDRHQLDRLQQLIRQRRKDAQDQEA